MDKQVYLLIGEMAKICNLSIQTLRFYDKKGLVSPVMKNEHNGYRYYAVDQIMQINMIKRLKKSGFTLKEMKAILKMEHLDDKRSILQMKYQEIDQTIEQLQHLKQQLQVELASYDFYYNEPHVKIIPTCVVAFDRHTRELNVNATIQHFSKLMCLIETHQYIMIGNPMAIYYDDYRTFDYQHADIEICAPIQGDVQQPHCRNMQSFQAVSMLHFGKYDTLQSTYQVMLDYIEKNGLTYEKGLVENYIIDGSCTKDEHEYITEILLPIE